jgi:hypothetical protein
MTATAVAAVTGYSGYWIGHIARRYNSDGPDGMRDQRHMKCAGQPVLSASQLAEFGTVLAGWHSSVHLPLQGRSGQQSR